MSVRSYKKYMKKSPSDKYIMLKLFVLTFFGMFLFFILLIKSFTPSVDVSIGGDYRYEDENNTQEYTQKQIDERLSRIQDEDNGRSFSDIMSKAVDKDSETNDSYKEDSESNSVKSEPKQDISEAIKLQPAEPVYKVYIGSYTSAEQAKVAKDIIQESGSYLNPIVKCIGSNDYTLQVGLFKNKNSAETFLGTVKQSHLPGRIVQEY